MQVFRHIICLLSYHRWQFFKYFATCNRFPATASVKLLHCSSDPWANVTNVKFFGYSVFSLLATNVCISMDRLDSAVVTNQSLNIRGLEQQRIISHSCLYRFSWGPGSWHLSGTRLTRTEQSPSWAMLVIAAGMKKALGAFPLGIKFFGSEMTRITSAYNLLARTTCLVRPSHKRAREYNSPCSWKTEGRRHLENSTNDYHRRRLGWSSRLQAYDTNKLSWDPPWKMRSSF